MVDTTIVLKSSPGIKRDGTKFEGDFYVDGQWVRWQRGLPRKMGGYKATQKYLTEISRGFSTFSQMKYVYCHSGGRSKLERFTLDSTGNSSIVTDRTPVAVAGTCTVTLTGGASGSVDSREINGVEIMSAPVAFTTNLATTATAVASNITAFASTPNYTAAAVGAVITITASATGSASNGETVVTATTITTTNTDMVNGSDAIAVSSENMWMLDRKSVV